MLKKKKRLTHLNKILIGINQGNSLFLEINQAIVIGQQEDKLVFLVLLKLIMISTLKIMVGTGTQKLILHMG